ncbi:MAG: hypothetical protein Ct9H90mP18_03350 [Gammaproteobacteria bacterium]|nr:MAG: hypothetical protein Ct9H90mP18_03350 [Gammaproteobacteria bacterium]
MENLTRKILDQLEKKRAISERQWYCRYCIFWPENEFFVFDELDSKKNWAVVFLLLTQLRPASIGVKPMMRETWGTVR